MNRQTAITLCGWLALFAGPLSAHPVSLSRASVYLTQQQANARIEVFLEDLYLFHQLKPNREDFLETPIIEQGIELHKQFLAERFEIANVDGTRVAPSSVEAVGVELPDEGVPLSELMGHQLVFELQYVFPAPPEFLTFTQRFTDEEAILPSEMKLEVKQENAGAPYSQTLLPNIPYSLRISWDNPPLSPEASEREQAAWAAREKEALLGITNYSTVYSFLYVEDYEVRHEILAPLLTLDEDLLISRDEDSMFDVAEQKLARPQIEAYFASGNPVTIDGDVIEPVVQRCDFYGLDMKDFAKSGEAKPVPLANARVGVILAYRLSDRPRTIQMAWDRFNRSLWGVTTVVIDGEETLRKKLSRRQGRDQIRWERPEVAEDVSELKPVRASNSESPSFTIPWLSLAMGVCFLVVSVVAVKTRGVAASLTAVALLVGGALAWDAPRWKAPASWNSRTTVNAGETLKAFRQLHENLYQAFERRTEESIYDALAVSVDGDLLRTVYLEVRRNLAMEDQGGAMARIRNVELLETHPADEGSRQPGETAVRCRWNVVGSVEHWGHLHQRTHQYEAEFSMRVVDGAWKLAELEMLGEEQLESRTTLRQ